MPHPIRIEFDTAPYECSHMKMPRGRGSWAFQFRLVRTFVAPGSWEWENGAIFTPGGMTYNEAKRALTKAIRETFQPDTQLPTLLVRVLS